MLMLVVSALLAFNALLLWVATGPRSLAAVTPYIEDALSSTDGSYNVKIGDTKLIWDGWKHPVDIRLNNVSVITREGKVFTVFPEIALGVNVLYLPLGQVIPTSLVINAPVMNLVQNDDLTFGFGFEHADESFASGGDTVPFPVLLSSFMEQSDDGRFRRLRRVVINNAQLNVKNSKKESLFGAQNLNIELLHNKGGEVTINNSATIHYNDYSTNIVAKFSMSNEQPNISGWVEFSELMPDVLAGLFYDNADVKSFAVPINGKITMEFDKQGTAKDIGFDIFGGKGSITSSRLAGSLPITSMRVKGSAKDDFRALNIDALSLNMDGMKLDGGAQVNFFDTSTEPDASPEIKAAIIITDVPSDMVNILWPPAVSQMSREWVTSSISGGRVPEAKLVVQIKKGDLKLPVLPKEAIDAELKVEGLNILYLPEHPPAKNVKGNIHIDGVSLAADIESAEYLEKTKLTNGHVLIDDLNADNPYIIVDLNADAPAKDMVHFLGLPRLKKAERLNLKENEAKGNVKGFAKVGFNFFAPKGQNAEDAIVYDVKAEVSGVTQDEFLNKFNIVNANGTVSVDNNGVEFSGTGEINGAVVSKSNVKYFFTPDKGLDTFIEVVAKSDIANLKRFGYPEFPFMKSGSIGVNAKVRLGDKLEYSEGKLDLTDAEVNFTDYGLKKPKSDAATLDISTEQKDGRLQINSFAFIGEKLSVKGSAALTDNFSTVASLQLSEARFDENNIASLNYANNDGMTQIDVKGSSIDMTAYLAVSSEGFSFQNFPAVNIKTDIGKLRLDSDRTVENLKGEIFCDKAICHNANFTGVTETKKPFSVKIFSNNNQRKIAVASEDAGAFLHSMGVLDGMNGGTLNINGDYKDDGTGVLIGRMLISEHTIKDAPLLGKILSLASLTGFIDALQGNGIRFKELNIPFNIRNDVITLEKGKTYGSAIGITVDGTITFPKKFMDLQGTVVPSYTLNNVLGNVPILGDMLVGGEGQGVFAARYSIKGVEDKADVSVNPLSILTPGFLRGLFDIFDKPAKSGDGK
jgi:hypothetical protein